MNDAQPSWLTEDCPTWYVTEHAEGDYPDDRSHQGQIATVPVVLREPALLEGHVTSSERAATFDLVRFEPIGSRAQWLFIGGDEVQLELSLESAKRLHAAMGAELDVAIPSSVSRPPAP